MTRACQLELLLILRRLAEHFAAAACTLASNKGFDATKITVFGAIAAIADRVARTTARRSRDTGAEEGPSALTEALNGTLGGRPVAVDPNTFLVQSETIETAAPELNLERMLEKVAFDNYPSGFPKNFVDSSQFLGPIGPLPASANSEKEMAKHMASESEISDTETTYVESQNTESSLGSSEDKRSGRSSILSTVVILLVELCEGLTYYTLAGTQKVYLQNQLDRSPSTSAAMNSVFSIWDCMLCYFCCIPGGLLADSVGRYKTIVMAGCVYALGTALVALAVIHEVQNTLDWLFMLGCFGLIPLGTGGIKPNIANFGADQIGDETEKQRESQKTFFSLFCLSMNIGVLNLSFVRIKRVKRNEQLFFWP
eukprot:symbB.v1.2.040481.t1/scaffold7270.1/size12210/2